MNPIVEVLQESNISNEKISELFQVLTENPLSAMAMVQGLGIPTEKLQPLMMTVMMQPSLIKEAVVELGLDFSKFESAKEKLQK